MSRSFKKTPICKDGSQSHRKKEKHFANKKVRKSVNVPNGKAYRKFHDPWEIYDYVDYGGSLRSYVEEEINKTQIYSWRKPKNILEAINDWEKWYYRK